MDSRDDANRFGCCSIIFCGGQCLEPAQTSDVAVV